MTVDTDADLDTLKQELKEGLMEAVSFATFCRAIAGRDLEDEVLTLQSAALALHAAAVNRLSVPAQRIGVGS